MSVFQDHREMGQGDVGVPSFFFSLSPAHLLTLMTITIPPQNQELNQKKRDKGKNDLKKEWRKAESERIEQGKKPFFLKKCKLTVLCLFTFFRWANIPSLLLCCMLPCPWYTRKTHKYLPPFLFPLCFPSSPPLMLHLTADEKKLTLVDQFLELKKKGRVGKFMAKRRKKIASKDRRYVPNQQ